LRDLKAELDELKSLYKKPKKIADEQKEKQHQQQSGKKNKKSKDKATLL